MKKSLLLFVLLSIIAISGLKILPGNNIDTKPTKTQNIDILPAQNIYSNESVDIVYKDLGFMKASWYGPRFHGKLTANGEVYDQMGLTVAHKSLPFGTLLKLTNPATNKSLIVRINDRGPYIPGRQIDLSMKVAMILGIYKMGVARLKVEKVNVKGVNHPVIN